MKPEDAEEYTQALGQVVAGGWRQIALGQRLGVPKALGLDVDAWVKQRLGGYVRLSVEERQPAVAELKAQGHSNREVAQIVGVDKETVRRDLGGANAPARRKEPQEHEPSNGASAPPDHEPLDVIASLAVSTDARERKARDDEREQRRQVRADVERARPAPAPLVGCFRLIYADPPWRYEHVKTESRAVENQYPTLDLDALCAMQPPAADDAVLFLWATSPKLAEALQVLDAWGFTYRTCAVWDKEQIGMGYYFRQQHELLLVGARGDAPVPAAEHRLPSVFRAKRSKHSEKPTFVYGYLEAMYPTFTVADRAELFARDKRAGWTPWSNEPEVVS